MTRVVRARIGWISILGTLLGLIFIISFAFFFQWIGVAFLVIVAVVALWEFRLWFIDENAVISGFNAVPADPIDDRELIEMVATLADRARVHHPRVFIGEVPYPNAFACSTRAGGIVAVTRPLYETLDGEELFAVLGHEVGHLKNRDSLWRILTAILVKSVMAPFVFLSALMVLFVHFASDSRDQESAGAFQEFFGLLIGGASIAMTALSSRSRELMADQSSVDMGANPEALITGLERLEEFDTRMHLTASQAVMAPMLLVPPFTDSWMQSHPSLKKRSRKLQGRLSVEERAAAVSRREQARLMREAERRTSEWQSSVDGQRALLRFVEAARARRPTPEETRRFRLRRDELVFATDAAELLEIRRPQGVDVWRATKRGLVAVTTKGLIFAADQRVRFDFVAIDEVKWLDAQTVVMSTTSRKHPSGVSFANESNPWRALVLVAEGVSQGSRQQLRDALELELQHLVANPPSDIDVSPSR